MGLSMLSGSVRFSDADVPADVDSQLNVDPATASQNCQTSSAPLKKNMKLSGKSSPE